MSSFLEDSLWGGIGLVIAGAIVAYLIIRHAALPAVRMVVKRSPVTWDDLLLDRRLLHRVALIFPVVVIRAGASPVVATRAVATRAVATRAVAIRAVVIRAGASLAGASLAVAIRAGPILAGASPIVTIRAGPILAGVIQVVTSQNKPDHNRRSKFRARLVSEPIDPNLQRYREVARPIPRDDNDHHYLETLRSLSMSL